MKIGIVTLATGTYYNYLNDLFASINKYFFPQYDKKIVYVTDSPEEKFNYQKVYFQHKKWPYCTLYKPKAINLTKQYFTDCDVVFWMDADLKCINYVTNENDLFPTKSNPICCVLHCGWLDNNGKEFILDPYEHNPKSLACVTDTKNQPYYQACFFGGYTKNFFLLTEMLEKNIDEDLKNNIIAVWHDESHLNKYLIDNPPKPIPRIYARPMAMGELLPNTKIVSILKDENNLHT